MCVDLNTRTSHVCGSEHEDFSWPPACSKAIFLEPLWDRSCSSLLSVFLKYSLQAQSFYSYLFGLKWSSLKHYESFHPFSGVRESLFNMLYWVWSCRDVSGFTAQQYLWNGILSQVNNQGNALTVSWQLCSRFFLILWISYIQYTHTHTHCQCSVQ